MPSVKNTLFVATAALVAGVNADYIIDPNSVPKSTRDAWCSSELSTCPLICDQTDPGTTLVNTCDADLLTYGCICGDGKQPNVSEYTLTLPYFTCTEWGKQCQAKCNNDNTCAAACIQDHPCGAQHPTTKNGTNATATTSTTSSATSSATNTVFTGLSGGSGSSSKSGAAAIAFGHSYGLAVVAGGLFAGFAWML